MRASIHQREPFKAKRKDPLTGKQFRPSEKREIQLSILQTHACVHACMHSAPCCLLSSLTNLGPHQTPLPGDHAPCSAGRTALRIATEKGFTECARLIQERMDADAAAAAAVPAPSPPPAPRAAGAGVAALLCMQAVQAGDSRQLRRALKEAPDPQAAVLERIAIGFTPLLAATVNSDSRCVQVSSAYLKRTRFSGTSPGA
jgi:hypothetical protein